MSMVITAPAKIATLSAATRKAFNALPIEALVHGVIFREGITDETGVRPSDIRMSSASAIAALGGKMSPQSFVQGLVFTAVRYAHGNMIDPAGLPAGSVIAVSATLSLIKKGAGISALSLETATLAGIKALLALPAPAKKAPAIAAPAIAAPAIAAPDPAPHWSTYSGPINVDADDAVIEAAVNAAIDAAAADAAAADAAAAEATEVRRAKAARFAADAKASADSICSEILKRADAEEIARQTAAALGFRLVKIPVKKAA